MKSRKAKPVLSNPEKATAAESPNHLLHDRTAAMADGLRKSHRGGDMPDREYARQMQEITREGADEYITQSK